MKIDLEKEANKLGPAEEIRLKSLEQDIKLRKAMAWTLIVLLFVVNVAAFSLLFLNGFQLTSLADNVLITLLGATVADLAGIVIVVANYLFPKPK